MTLKFRSNLTANGMALVAAVAALGMTLPVSAKPVPARMAPFDLTITNRGCFKGRDVTHYVNQAIAQRVRAGKIRDGGELGSFFVRVPARAWRGLTVTGVGLHYESSSVYFREPAAVVRRTLERSGVRFGTGGAILIDNEEAVEVQYLAATGPESRAYGASGVTCGV